MADTTTAREIVLSLPDRLKKDIPADYKANIHLDLEGEGGGQFTVTVADGTCQVTESFEGEPDCTVRTKASTYADTELGRENPAMAVLMGKIKVSNIGVLTKFITFFHRL